MKTLSGLFTFLFATVSVTLVDAAPPATYRDSDIVAEAAASADVPNDWWKLFEDAALEELITHAVTANRSLQATAARVEQARAVVGVTRSAYWPQLDVTAGILRERTSRTTDTVLPDTLTTTYRAPLGVSWEIDVFGRVRRQREAATADAEAAVATYHAVRLAVAADAATHYFSLRAADRELSLVREAITLRRRALDLVSARHRSGIATELDTARAEAELAQTESEAAAVANERAALQNALAVLAGQPAPEFRLVLDDVATSTAAKLPVVPAGLPASLLERRPDIASAERSLAAAHARIGVAKAAFFPAISLTGAGGYASGELDGLFQSGSRIWLFGPSVYLPLFQGGRNRANLARSRAVYEEAAALYEQQVLTAFREVQDALTASRLLAEQASAQERALASARRAASLAETRYTAGLVSYLEVIDARRTTLATERATVRLQAQRLNTTIALIRALGGGWRQPDVVAAN